MTAMMHHERCDGTSYPMGLHSDRIDKFAKIVMIADVIRCNDIKETVSGAVMSNGGCKHF